MTEQTEGHESFKVELTERDQRKLEKIGRRVTNTFMNCAREASEILGGAPAGHNYGVHMLVKAAAHAAVWNALANMGREPRPEYWDAACKAALENARENLRNGNLCTTYRMVLSYVVDQLEVRNGEQRS